VEELERALAHFESILSKAAGIPLRDRPGTGAAGGMGMAILALGGELQSGFDFVAKVLGLGKKMEGCDLVITSEGRLDASSLEGKTPVAVARMAKSLGIPCVAVVGAADPHLDRLAEAGISRVYPLFDRPIAMNDPRRTEIPERLAQAIRSLLKENITR
jgi:glycerate kinase